MSLEDLRQSAAHCQACGLWRNATQTVFGEGPVPSRLMLVGEQPGDQEDRSGRPFVGPAGRVLDAARSRTFTFIRCEAAFARLSLRVAPTASHR